MQLVKITASSAGIIQGKAVAGAVQPGMIGVIKEPLIGRKLAKILVLSGTEKIIAILSYSQFTLTEDAPEWAKIYQNFNEGVHHA